MQVLRKLLLPIMLWFAIALVGLLAYQYFSTVNANQHTAEADFEHYYESFDEKIESAKQFALGLATQAATNPDIQAAFAEHDREKLTALTLESYQQLNQQFGIPQYQYHLPPATSFLRLHQLDKFGDDLSAFRATVVEANRTGKPVGGLEVGRGGLGVRGVVPVQYSGQHIGTVEFGLNVDVQILASLRGEYGVNWSLWLEKEQADLATFVTANTDAKPPIKELVFQTSTLKAPTLNTPAAYLAALQGNKTLSRVVENGHTFAIYSAPLYDYSGEVIGVVDIIEDRTAAVNANLRQLLINLALIFTVLASAVAIIFIYGASVLRPIRALTDTAHEIANGNMSRNVNIHSGDEFEQLGNTFNAMTTQLRELIGTLENRVQERTLELENRSQVLARQSTELAEVNAQTKRRAAQLEAIAEVASEIASLQKIEDILPSVTRLISEKFGFYHTGIFLVDEAREYAVLVAANSAGGERMLARGHKLKVGKVGIVGYVTGSGNPRIALDTGMDAVYFDNPDLPNSHSEMALPLHSSKGVIGALDVQSTEANAFNQEDIRVLSTLADQISIAIENDRLFEETKKSLSEVETIYRQYLRQEWGRIARVEKLLGFHYENGKTQALEAPLSSPEIQKANQEGTLQTGFDEENNRGSLAIPILLRGETIGVLNVRASGKKNWKQDELTITQEIANRVAVALENARLLDESQRRASKEQAISQIATKISASVNMRNVLQTTVAELGRALPGSDIVIQFANPTEEPDDQPKTGEQ